ncbi:hypothetical protein D3C75_1076340 [compost metagenome]
MGVIDRKASDAERIAIRIAKRGEDIAGRNNIFLGRGKEVIGIGRGIDHDHPDRRRFRHPTAGHGVGVAVIANEAFLRHVLHGVVR